MRVRVRGMTLSMVGIGLFKTQGLDEYGTAAVGWLQGAGLKATEGPAEHRGGGIQTLARSLARSPLCAQVLHTHATHDPHKHRRNDGSHKQRCNYLTAVNTAPSQSQKIFKKKKKLRKKSGKNTGGSKF